MVREISVEDEFWNPPTRLVKHVKDACSTLLCKVLAKVVIMGFGGAHGELLKSPDFTQKKLTTLVSLRHEVSDLPFPPR